MARARTSAAPVDESAGGPVLPEELPQDQEGAVVVDWTGAPDLEKVAHRMVSRLSHRSPDGMAVVGAPGAAAPRDLTVANPTGYLSVLSFHHAL